MIPGASAIHRAILQIAVAITVGFVALPLIIPVVVSFSSLPFLAFPPVGFSLEWYQAAIQNSEFIDSVLLSVKLAVAVTAISVPLGTTAAVGLSWIDYRGKSVLQALLLSPLIIPMLVTGLALLQFFSELSSEQVFLHLLIGHVVVTVPYVLRSVTAGLQTIDPELEAAAQSLGATRLEAFFKITLPQLSMAIFGGGLFAFVTSFDNFPITLWLKNSEFTPFPLFIYSEIARFLDPSIAAMCTLMIIFSFSLIIAAERVLGLKRFMTE